MAWRREENGDIVIDGWEKGIAENAFDGIFDMVNIDIESNPGCATAKLKPIRSNAASTSSTFTVDTTTDIVTVASSVRVTYANGNNNANGLTCTLTNSGGALPAGLATGTVYWIIADASSTTFKLANSFANYLTNTPVDITGTGTGTHTLTTVSMGQVISSDIAVEGTSVGNQSFVVLDNNGVIWVQKQSLATSYNTTQWVQIPNGGVFGSTGNGATLKIFQNALFVFRGATVDVYFTVNNFSTAGTWYNAWKTTLTSVYLHPLYVGTDNTLYWGDASATTISALGYIGSLRQNASTLIFTDTGNPTTSTNFTFSTTALDLPSGEIPTAISELGVNLMIGTVTNKLFPWDRVSDSFSIPLAVPQRNCRRLINANNILYIFSGSLGRVYKTNGSQAVIAFSVPTHIIGSTSSTSLNEYASTWADIEYIGDNLIFSVNDNGVTSGITAIYKYNITTGTLQRNNLEGAAGVVNIVGAIFPGIAAQGAFAPSGTPGPFGYSDVIYTYIWSTSGTNQANVYTNLFTDSYTDDSCYVISDAIPIGTFLRNTTLSQIEFKLAKPMSLAGDFIKLQYRKVIDASASFTDIGSYTYDSAFPDRVSFEFPINVENSEWLQIKCVSRAAEGTGQSLLPLREIRIR